MSEAVLVLLATKNGPKARELGELLTSVAGTISLAAWEAAHRPLPEAPEEGESFAENAALKALAYARATGLPALADDSGLSVTALNNAPGIFSARYGGPGLSDEDRCRLLLEQLAGQPDRQAFFTCALCLAQPSGATLTWQGQTHGLIARTLQGKNGFGYDPLFYHPASGRCFAELTAAEKNQVSHRGRAARLFLRDRDKIKRFLEVSGCVW